MKKNVRMAAKALVAGAVAAACVVGVTGSVSALDRTVLTRGNSMNVGDRLLAYYSGVTYELILQTDGNLVEYKQVGGSEAACWASNTMGQPSHHATYQTDGNFVLYDSNGTKLWASDTKDAGGSSVSINNDGSFWVGTVKKHGAC